MSHSCELATMIEAAQQAGRALLTDFRKIRSVAPTPDAAAIFLARTDAHVATLLRTALTTAHADYGILIEGSDEIQGAGSARWIVDPLDGYGNFARGLSHWAVSIALEKDGEIVAAVVHDPLRQETFSAAVNEGAWLNNETRLRVAEGGALRDAVLATGLPGSGSERTAEALSVLSAMLQSAAAIRQLGAAALDMAYVASDRLDGYWNRHLHLWHYAAGMLLVREAGGTVVSVEGQNKEIKGGGLVAIRKPMADGFVAAFQSGVSASAK